MAEKVGELFYDVTLETAQGIRRSRDMQRENARTGDSFDALTPKITSIVRAIQIYAAALAVVKSSQAADEVRLLGARVEVAAGSVERGTQAMRELVDISTRSRSAVGDNVQVFARLNQSILQLGGTQKDTLELTELLGKAIAVSGASAQEKSSAMIQFGQALGSGKLAGDELRSLLENAPYLMRQLADGLGVPIGALKRLGEDGKLTSDVVVKAMQKAANTIEADFKKLPVTLDSAMTVSADALRRFNAATDEASGKTLALTGVVQGAGEVFDLLALRINQASEKQDALGKSTTIQTWKDNTVTALSYVLDAADFVVRGFQQIGLVIYRTALAAKAAATGGFAEARDELALLKKELLDIGSAQYAGARIRQQVAALATGTDGSDRLDRLGRGGAGTGGRSSLRGGGGGGAKDKFDDAAYLAGLAQVHAEGLEKINLAEAEALRKNAQLRAQGKISRKTEAEAAILIERNATQERLAIAAKFELDRLALQERMEEEHNRRNEEAAKAAEEARARGREAAMAAIAGANPVVALELEAQQKTDILKAAAQIDMENAQLYAETMVAIEQEKSRRIAEIQQRQIDQQNANNAMSLQLMGQFSSDVFSLLQRAGKERTALAKAAFLASKAIAVAEIILQTEVAAAKATGQLGIFGIPLSAAIRATGYASAGMVGGMALAETFGGGRQYGGPVSAGSMYRVNETGRPEMFTAANGTQYMMPTANGNVTPADRVGGGQVVVMPEFRVINQAPQLVGVSQRRGSDGQPELVIAEVAAQISERRGPVWRAMTGTTNVRGTG